MKKALEKAYPLSPTDYIMASLHNCGKRFSGSSTIMSTDNLISQIPSKHLSPSLTSMIIAKASDISP